MTVRRGAIDGWNNKNSVFAKTKGKNAFSGTFLYHGLQFPFSIAEQKQGKYLMRGHIGIISPVDGYYMQHTGNVQEETVKKSGDKAVKHPSKSAIKAEVYCNSTCEADIKVAIADAAEKLYLKNLPTVLAQQKRTVRPENISPAAAAYLYAQKFVGATYKGANHETSEKRAETLKKMFASLPDISMGDYTLNRITTWQQGRKVSKENQKIMMEFWEWLLQNGYAIGQNPFPPLPKKAVSPKVKQMRAQLPDELDIAQQDELYKQLCKDPPSGVKCGISSMLWGGLTASHAVKLHWYDVLFKGDTVQLKIERELVGPTQNFRRPVFPQAAEFLRQRYDELCQKYSVDEVSKMPIVSQSIDPNKAMTANELIQTSGTLLRRLGVSEATFAAWKTPGLAVSSRILSNSYKKNITTRCGFGQENRGIQNFLMGYTLAGDTTSGNYTSFTCDEAVDRIVTSMAALGPKRKMPSVKKKEKLPDGLEKCTYTPRTTREILTVTNGLALIMPGGSFECSCMHGVTPTLSVEKMSTSVDAEGQCEE